MRSTFRSHFTTRFVDHPRSVGESYGEHFRCAAGFAGELALASGACAMHALVPSMFTTSASQRVRRLHADMTAGARGAAGPAPAPVLEMAHR